MAGLGEDIFLLKYEVKMFCVTGDAGCRKFAFPGR
jgi:hypothetical protein